MKHQPLLVLSVGGICLAVGVMAGYLAGKSTTGSAPSRAVTIASLASSDRDAPSSRLQSYQAPAARRGIDGQRHKPGHGEEGEERPIEENPYYGKPAAELIAVLNQRDHDSSHHWAMKALSDLTRNSPASVAALLPDISRHEAMHRVCRELVMHGGTEGLKAVLGFIADTSGNMEMRREAIHALGSLPPESRQRGEAGLVELMERQLPHELQHAMCHAYAELSKGEAVEKLFGLLGRENCRLRPEIIVDTIGHVGSPADTQQLLGLLKDGSWTGDMQATILRSAARAAKNGGLLLDLLASPHTGLSSHTVARALAEAAPWITVEPEAVIAALRNGFPPAVRADLARALIRSGGDRGVERLLELATDLTAGIDADSLGAALAESRRQDLVPAMVDLFGSVKDFETMHQLARSIVEAGGRQGVDALMDLLESGEVRGHRVDPLCGSLAEAGSPEDAARLFDLLNGPINPESARAILKAAVSLCGETGLDRCLAVLREATNGDARAAAADVIGHLDASGHVPILIDVLAKEEFGRAQWHLAHALARAGEEGMNELTAFFSNDGNEHRKQEILESLVHLDDYDATPFFTQALLSDDMPPIRDHAAEILSRIADERAIAALTQALNQESDPGVREHLVEHLARAQERLAGRRRRQE